MTVDPTRAVSSPSDALGGIGFVLLWSTGYVAAVFALQGTGAYTLAVLRFLGTAAIIGAWVMFVRLPRARTAALVHAAIGGVLLQSGFFGFTYAGLRAGVPPAAAGLIAGLMPLTTALGARVLLGERMGRSATIGLLLGLAGVLLVVVPDLRAPETRIGYLFVILALMSLSLGTIYQKRHAGELDARVALIAQVLAAAAVVLPFALVLEGIDIHLTSRSIGGMAWVIVVNSCAGLLLYLWLLKRGAAGRVASVFFLVPPVTAVLTAVFFGARFTAPDAAGFALTAAGVWLGQRG
ncbi:MAG: family permease [Panacagrimonas sp.]|jgi:drug/metabolite transporter (DMT)-like permease|nr:DMT family transporter [Panacagrimonas sp.]MCC2656040.1 family permease [Panacagrimonas sp.]